MTSAARRSGRRSVPVILALLLALIGILASATPALAAEGDPYRISGNVQLDGEPLDGVDLTIDGPGGLQEVTTDENGQWAVSVPEQGEDATYTVTLIEDTLPEGIAVVDEEDDTPNVREVTVGAGGRVAVNFFIGEGERNTTSFIGQLIQRVVQGLNFGLMLALAAVGLSLVFGTTGISNFAHGEMVTFGAVAAFFLVGPATLALPMWLGLPMAVVLGAVVGLLMDMILWRPLRKKRVGIVQLMIVSIGLSLAMRYTFQFFIGGGTLQLPYASVQRFDLGLGIQLSPIDIVSIIISLIVIIGFAVWLTKSRIGKATRAISDNPSLASATGIDVDFVVRIVWVVAGALAALSGILYAYFRPGIRWDMGTQVLLLMFAAVILGGLGTAYGALLGALIVGVVVEISGLWIPADLRFASGLLILIVILLFRPQGILGKRERIG